MTDHKAEAIGRLGFDLTLPGATAGTLEALTHAVLHMAEQQRLANLIALNDVQMDATGQVWSLGQNLQFGRDEILAAYFNTEGTIP